MSRRYQHLLVVAFFFIICSVYFSPFYQGKVIPQSDMIGFVGKAQEILDHEKQTGNTPLWSNAIFGGMPSYMVVGPYKSNLLLYLNELLVSFRPISMFLMMMVSFYFLMVYMKVRPWVGAIASVAFALSTYYMTTYEAGHISKLNSIAYFPLILISALMLLDKKYIKGSIILALSSALTLMNGHYQMIYYLAIALAILAGFEIYKVVKSKDYSHLGKVILALVVGMVLGFSTSASKLLTLQEYTSQSAFLKQVARVNSQIVLPKDYHGIMRWHGVIILLMLHRVLCREQQEGVRLNM